jgi:hypothetical protein
VERKIISWNEPLGNAECPYCYRWVFNLGLFAVRLHKWVASDDTRAMHDHPYSFITIILKGYYVDVSEDKVELLSQGKIRFRKAEYKHYVNMDGATIPCWSLVLSGPVVRGWGFWVNGKFLRREKYFKRFGHQCQ